MAPLSRRNFFRVLPAAPVAVVAASSPSFDEQLADAIAEIDATAVLTPPTPAHTDARERLRVLLDGRYLGRADRLFVDPVKEAAHKAAVDEHYRWLEAHLSGETSGSTSDFHQAASAECRASPDTAVTCRALEGAA